MADLLTILQGAAGGFKVNVKTQFGPAIEVYDSTAAPSPPGLLQAAIGPVGVQVTDTQGNVLDTVGSWPDTNPLAIAVIAGAFVALGYLIYRGLR